MTVKTREIRQKEPKGERNFGAEGTMGRLIFSTFLNLNLVSILVVILKYSAQFVASLASETYRVG